MMTWDALVHKQKNKEMKYIMGASVVILLGCLNEIWIRRWQAGFVVHNYESIALAILQIQATVFTLSIALIALLAGFITDRYLGIRYNDFIFNIKPRYLKQKTVIATELLLLLTGLVMQMVACYNMVFALFVVACLLIWFSVTEVYRVFAEASSLEDEIRAYLRYSFKNKEYVRELTKCLCGQWKREMLNQDDATFRTYEGIFGDAFISMFPNGEDRHALLDQCVSMARILLRDANTTQRGLNFIWKCYILASNYISETIDKENGLYLVSNPKASFPLFANTYYYIVKGIERLSIDEVKKYSVLWDGFTKMIAKVAVCLQEKTEMGDSSGSDLEAIIRFGSFIGDYLSAKYIPYYPREKYDSIVRCALFETKVNNKGMAEKSPQKQLIESTIAERDFNLKVQLILNGEDDLIREYYAKISRCLNMMSEPFALMVIRFHCFLYYLAFYESEACIGTDVKQKAAKLLNESAVKKSISLIVFSIIREDKNIKAYFGKKYDIFHASLIPDFIGSMEPYQQFHDDNTFIGNVMSGAAEEFIVCLILYVSQLSKEPQFLDSIIPDNRAESYYYQYILKTVLRDSLKRFLDLLGLRDGEIDTWGEASIDDLRMVLLKKSKSYEIQVAQQRNKVLYKELQQNEKQIEDELKAKLEHDFSGIVSDVGEEDAHIFELMQLTVLVDTSLSDLIENVKPDLFNCVVNCLKNHLWLLHKIKCRNRLKKDQDKIDYIRSMQAEHEFIGSEFVLEPMDYKLRHDFIDTLQETRHCTSESNGDMLVLKKDSLRIGFDRVWIESHPETIADIEIATDPSTGDYLYEVSLEIVVPFTKEELEEYLKNHRSIVKIYTSVRLQIADGVIGEAI